ncbi:MAG: NAD+ synthase [Acidimicrobiales bacterium]
MPRLRVALCQVNAVVGDLGGNVDKVVSFLGRAEDHGADVAIFPELVLTGYPPEDLLAKPEFIEENLHALDVVVSATRHCAAVVGYVEAEDGLYNAAAVAAGGKLSGTWRKQLLPNYGVFDEQRWFRAAGGAGCLFVIGGARVGVVVCEDVWSPTGPAARLGRAGAELLAVLNASPYRHGVVHDRRKVLSGLATQLDATIAYVNLVGGQDELVFDGGSMIFDEAGEPVASAPQFEEALVVADLELAGPCRVPGPERPAEDAPGDADDDFERPVVVTVSDAVAEHQPIGLPAAPVTIDLSEAEQVYRALVLATRDYVEKNSFSDVLVAISGGIDSALVATIAADAVGPERVHGVLLPSRYSSKGSLSDAGALADNLRIEVRTIPIEAAHATFLDVLGPSFGGAVPGSAEENLQARIRGTIVMALSNGFGWLVLTTGNKSEMAVGYATLYGDMAGGFAVIKDVPKTLVYELCRYRNGLRSSSGATGVIPEAILSKAPSAELRPGQRDEDSLPPYDELDPILTDYVELDRSIADIVAAGHDPEVVSAVARLVDLAEYKRRQAAPGPRVTSRAFGKDRRMPVTNRFRSAPSVPRPAPSVPRPAPSAPPTRTERAPGPHRARARPL